jgi:hypothetical protein
MLATAHIDSPILASPDFQRLLKDVGARIVTEPRQAGEANAR